MTDIYHEYNITNTLWWHKEKSTTICMPMYQASVLRVIFKCRSIFQCFLLGWLMASRQFITSRCMWVCQGQGTSNFKLVVQATTKMPQNLPTLMRKNTENICIHYGDLFNANSRITYIAFSYFSWKSHDALDVPFDWVYISTVSIGICPITSLMTIPRMVINAVNIYCIKR